MLKLETVHGFEYPNGSIYDAMNNNNVPWRLYNDVDFNNNRHSLFSDDPKNGSKWGGIPQVASLKGITISKVRTLSKFAEDLQDNYLYQYTFIEPNYGDVKSGNYAGGSSQHPMDDVFGGENLIKYVYESIRNSPIWNSSLLVITYDEHGGFYDSVAPGTVQAPNDNSSSQYNQFGFDFTQYGVRVPGVIISPWVAAGVDGTVYDHSSVLATVEELFGLSPLTQRDGKAKDFTHLFLPTPRTNCPMTLNDPAAPVAAAQKSLSVEQLADVNAQPLPESGNEIGCLTIALKTDIELSSGEAADIDAIIEKVKNITTLGEADDYINAVMAKVDQLGATGS